MGPRTATRGRRFGFALFALTIVCSSGFAACASLKSAPALDDAGPDGTAGEADGNPDDEDADARTLDDGGAAGDAAITDADAGRSRWPYCSTNGSLCSCMSFGLELDSSSCAAADFPSGFCCADPGWPTASNATCTCSAWTCRTNPSGTCVCGAYEGGTASSCSDTYCCAHPTVSTCSCAATTNAACPTAFADANNIPVASCTQASQPCAKGGTRVPSCNF